MPGPEPTMPAFERIDYTQHARERMDERRIRHEQVDLTLRTGEVRSGKDDTWIYEWGRYRVVITEHDGVALVLTVIRLRGR